MLYSKQTGGFYSREIHGDNIPADAVEITTEKHDSLLQGQSSGKQITADENGYPILVDPPAPTPEQLQQQTNTQARAYLASTDWYVIRLQENGTPIPQDILDARQAARDSVIEVGESNA